jgi:hypothetical protein
MQKPLFFPVILFGLIAVGACQTNHLGDPLGPDADPRFAAAKPKCGGVPKGTTSLAVNPASIPALLVGSTVDLAVTNQNKVLVPDCAVTWSISDATIASIDAQGIVRGLKVGGPLTVRVATVSGRSLAATSVVTVTPQVAQFPGVEFLKAVASGNDAYFLLGALKATTTIAGTTFTPSGISATPDAILIKVNRQLQAQWAVKVDALSGGAITSGPGGRLIFSSGWYTNVAGAVNGPVTVQGPGGQQTFNSTGLADGILLAISPTGTLAWSAQLTGGSYEGLTEATTDAAGNIYITGFFNGCCPSFNNATLTTSMGSSMTVAAIGFATGVLFKISPDGMILWNSRVGRRDAFMAYPAFDAAEAQLVTLSSARFDGWYGSTTNFVDGTGTPLASADACQYSNCLYITAFDAVTGGLRWIMKPLYNTDFGIGVLTSTNGKYLLLYRSANPVTFSAPAGGTSLDVPGGSGADSRSLVRISGTGVPESSLQYSSTGSLSWDQTAAAPNGTYYIAHTFSGALSMDGQTISAPTSTDGVVLGVSSTFAVATMARLQGLSGTTNALRGVAVAPDGRTLIAGTASAGAVIAGYALPSSGGLLYLLP